MRFTITAHANGGEGRPDEGETLPAPYKRSMRNGINGASAGGMG